MRGSPTGRPRCAHTSCLAGKRRCELASRDLERKLDAAVSLEQPLRVHDRDSDHRAVVVVANEVPAIPSQPDLTGPGALQRSGRGRRQPRRRRRGRTRDVRSSRSRVVSLAERRDDPSAAGIEFDDDSKPLARARAECIEALPTRPNVRLPQLGVANRLHHGSLESCHFGMLETDCAQAAVGSSTIRPSGSTARARGSGSSTHR